MAQFLREFYSLAIPIVCIVGAVAVASFVTCFSIYRWRQLKPILCRITAVLLRKPQYDYSKIFQCYAAKIDTVKDRRELYNAVLESVAHTVSSDGASILVKDESTDKFSLKASIGVRPFTFDVSEVKGFIDWLESKRQLVSRRYLLNSKKCRDIKIDGLRYCVQFNAEVCIPIFVKDKLYALLNLGGRKKGFYDAETRELLSVMTMHFATVIHNADLYQRLAKQNSQIQTISAFKNQLLSNLSHELRTPLNSIIGLSELMAEGGDGPVSSDQLTHLTMIRQSGQRLLNTVTSMLDLSKLESNKLELDIKHISLGRLVSSAAERVALNKDTKLVVDLKEEIPSIYGDEDRLMEVFKQILDNAAKFTKRGKIIVEASKTGEMVKVCVKDTGIGIRKEERQSIFEGFTQGDGSHTREHEGLGLGLPIARKIVELHGGRMWLKSKEGKGTEFFLTLPIKPTGVRHNEI